MFGIVNLTELHMLDATEHNDALAEAKSLVLVQRSQALVLY